MAPVAPKHPCAAPGCPTLVPRGQSRCAVHKAVSWAGAGKPYGREWDRIRRTVLQEEPLCRMCPRSSTTVDHIVPKARGGTDDRSNLQGLCALHAQEKNGQDAAEGRRLAQRSRTERERS